MYYQFYTQIVIKFNLVVESLLKYTFSVIVLNINNLIKNYI